MRSNAEKVVVAMSGGVDSAAAALLLQEQGYDVVGISMQVWDYRRGGGNEKRATCCAPADFEDAREVSRRGEFPYYVFDFEESFEESVINPFVNSYLKGETPNPCVECNRKVKFKELRRRAAALGADYVATGHYAQIKPKSDGTLGLFTSKDTRKDQSYFLFAMTQEELGKTLFPVGAMQKSIVREYLRERGVPVMAEKPESQDICFVSSSVPEFIEKKTGKVPVSGEIRTEDGVVIGEHGGIHQFTVGQRKGLGGGSPHPLFVLQIHPDESAITVGPEEALRREEFFVRDVNWVSGKVPTEPLRSLVKLRYRNAGVPCELSVEPDNRVRGRFLEDWTAVSPGQAAVFYSVEPDSEGDFEVLGGGTLDR